jgi:hypothetical protein
MKYQKIQSIDSVEIIILRWIFGTGTSGSDCCSRFFNPLPETFKLAIASKNII